MSRSVLAALAAVALLLAGGILAVVLLEREPGAAAGPAPMAAPAPAAATQPREAPAPGGEPPRSTPVRPPAAAQPPAAVSPLPADVVARRAALEPLRREVLAGLSALDGRIAACKLARGEVLLVLETLDGRVRVVEARVPEVDPSTVPEGVAAPPEESPRAVACVRGALEGVIVSAPSARPGRRWEQPWAVGAPP